MAKTIKLVGSTVKISNHLNELARPKKSNAHTHKKSPRVNIKKGKKSKRSVRTGNIGQKWLTDRADTLRENNSEMEYASNASGICFGLANMAKQAILAGDLDTFNQRLQLIKKIPVGEFRKITEDVKSKQIQIIKQVKSFQTPQSTELKNILNELQNVSQPTKEQQKKLNAAVQTEIQTRLQTELTDNEKLVSSFKPFLDGVELYEQGYKHPEYFSNAPATQESGAPGQVVDSLALESGSTKVTTLCGQYTTDTLQKYFHSLHQTVRSCDFPVAFVLDSADHSITIGYDPIKSRWSCIDPSIDPDKPIYIPFNAKGERKLARLVLSGFSSNGIANFSTEVSVTESNHETMQQKLQSLKKKLAGKPYIKLILSKHHAPIRTVLHCCMLPLKIVTLAWLNACWQKALIQIRHLVMAPHRFISPHNMATMTL